MRGKLRVGLPFAVALKSSSRFFTKLRTCRGEMSEYLIRAQSSAPSRGGDHGLAFICIHEASGIEDLRLCIGFNHEKPMLVRMDEIPRHNLATEDLDLAIPTHRLHMRVADAESSSQGLETRIGHFINIANGPIDNGSNTTERAMRIAVDLAPKGTDYPRFVEILNDDDFWPRNVGYVATILLPRICMGFAMRLVARLDNDSNRVANHRPHLLHEISNLFKIKTMSGRIASRDLFPAIVDRRRIPSLQLQ